MNRPLLLQSFAGVLFGAGLAISGMTNPRRVVGFLDVTGSWDPALMFVMAGALGTFAVGISWLRRRNRGAGWFGATLPCRNSDPVDAPLVLGATLFGIGWGIAGFCPGPALANLAAFRTEALLFVPAMAVGMLLARATAGVDRE